MPRFLLILALAVFATGRLPAEDDEPPISITSPDHATTYVYASIQQHALLWDKRSGLLLAHIVFVPVDQEGASGDNDAHDFRLPGVTFDEKKGLFFATTAKGEVIPIARIKKTLFLKSIETLPNAVVRVEHPRGSVSVVLEAIHPNDKALRPTPASAAGPDANTDSDGNQLHQVDIHDLLH